jgi:hypothetical protein
MLATNSPSASGGITQYSIFRLVRADRFHDLQFHHLIGQQPQRPMAEAGGRLAQPHGDQLRLGGAIEQLRRWRCRAFSANQRTLKAFQDECLPHVLNRPRSTTDRLADLGVIPRWPVGVDLEQDRRPPQFLGLALFLLDGRFANRPFLVREPHDILLVHGNLLVDVEFPKIDGFRNPNI